VESVDELSGVQEKKLEGPKTRKQDNILVVRYEMLYLCFKVTISDF